MDYKAEAERIIELFLWFPKDETEQTRAKACAAMCVKEIIEAVEAFGYCHAMYDDYETGQITTTDEKNPTDHWNKVLEHINQNQ